MFTRHYRRSNLPESIIKYVGHSLALDSCRSLCIDTEPAIRFLFLCVREPSSMCSCQQPGCRNTLDTFPPTLPSSPAPRRRRVSLFFLFLYFLSFFFRGAESWFSLTRIVEPTISATGRNKIRRWNQAVASGLLIIVDQLGSVQVRRMVSVKRSKDLSIFVSSEVSNASSKGYRVTNQRV